MHPALHPAVNQITGLLGRLGGEIELVLEQFHLSRPEAEEVLRPPPPHGPPLGPPREP